MVSWSQAIKVCSPAANNSFKADGFAAA